MGEWGVITTYKEYYWRSTSNITTINATMNKTEQEEHGDDKPPHKYAINSNNKVMSCINSNRNDDFISPFNIYHQNIREIKGKIDEFMIHWSREALDIICLTERHFRDLEMEVTHFPTYKLGAKFCRRNLKNGGDCIFIREGLKFTIINVQKHCKEQDLEIAIICTNKKKGEQDKYHHPI
jgi:hypothetical protein